MRENLSFIRLGSEFIRNARVQGQNCRIDAVDPTILNQFEPILSNVEKLSTI